MEGDNLMSQTLKFDFKVSSASGKNWIVLEPVDKNLNVLGDVSLTFNLAEGVTVNQAEEIAAYLKREHRLGFLHGNITNGF
jgi:hypothetical protein